MSGTEFVLLAVGAVAGYYLVAHFMKTRSIV